MVEVRPPNPAPSRADKPDHRLRLLLSCAGWQDEAWADALPRLLQPMGVEVVRAHCGREATDILKSTPIHIAVVDLSLPLEQSNQSASAAPICWSTTEDEAGPRLLQLLTRLDAPPPTVVVRPRRTRREDARSLATALNAGAFAVVDRPVHLETVLDVMRRVLRRFYSDRWPSGPAWS